LFADYEWKPMLADWLVLGVLLPAQLEYYNEQEFLSQPLACTPVIPQGKSACQTGSCRLLLLFVFA
jgi:hypothetical protein